MNNEEYRDAYLDGIQNTIHCLDRCNGLAGRKRIAGFYWYCLIDSPMDLFYNTTLSDSFACSGRDSFRWIGQLKGGANPTLFTISKTKKKNIYIFHWLMLFKENSVVGKPLKFTLLEDRIKSLCAEQYQKDGNEYNHNSEETYKKIYLDSILLFDKDTINSKIFYDLKEALCTGIISMYQAVTATCVTTDYSDGVLLFPIEKEEELNKIFKYRDAEDGKKRRSPIYSVVKEHTRNGSVVEHHLRTKGFTYNGRIFGLILGSDAFNNKFGRVHNEKISPKAIARVKKAKKTDSVDLIDNGAIFANKG